MIHINLLPPSMRLQPKTREAARALTVGNKILMMISGGAFALVVSAYFFLALLPAWWVQAGTARLQKQWTALEASFGELDVLSKEGKVSGARLAELARKKTGRWRWARILNAISDVMPSSVQLTRISSGQLAEMVPMPPAKPAAATQAKAASAPAKASGDAPPAAPQKTRRYFQALEMEGIVEKGVLGEEDLKALMEQIKQHPVFAQTFERVELIGVATQPDMTKKFSLRCRFKEKAS